MGKDRCFVWNVEGISQEEDMVMAIRKSRWENLGSPKEKHYVMRNEVSYRRLHGS